jgi:hypothetical protein
MPINPNIILSGNQMATPQLPDVNAMMQTRTAGMENIYKNEQARAEEAKAAQKEQAAALVDALAPAYATAFKGGGTKEAITAGYNLLSPEIQTAVKGQFDKLMAMPSDDLRLSALEAGLAGSEAGRTLFDRIPTEIQRINAEIQRGQLEVSRAKAAREAAAVGVPKPMSEYEAERIKLDREKAEREAAKVSPDAAKQQQAVNDMKLAVTELTAAAAPGGLIDLSTGSIAGDWLDSLVAQGSGGFFTLPGDVAAAQMEVVAHLARMAVPRFEGPQSEKDAALYERASGQLADPRISTTIKKAAAQTLIDIISKRKDQFVSSGVSTETAGGGADSGVLEYDADGNLIE